MIIKSYEDIEKIQCYTPFRHSYYRGLSSMNHTLLPSLTRKIRCAEKARNAEKYIWEKISTNNIICDFFHYPIEEKTRQQEWELALLCRHSGVLSRIMEFTPTTKIACWFAAIENGNEDGALWEMILPESIRNRDAYEKFLTPCEIAGTNFFRSSIVSRGEESFNSMAERNSFHQNAFCFVQSMEDSVIPLEQQNLIQLIRHRIPASSKQIIINTMKNFKVAQKYTDFVYAEDTIIKNEIDKINSEVLQKFT